MTGYTRTSLDGGYQSDAHSDNYHLGLYGDKRFGALALRAGARIRHRIDTSRSVNYGAQSDRERPAITRAPASCLSKAVTIGATMWPILSHSPTRLIPTIVTRDQ